MENKIPESWVGRDLVFCRTGSTKWELIVLREVSELGIAYTYKDSEVEGEPVFVPWSSVSWMRPPIPADLEDTEPEAE